ncbi:dihydroxyacetone kinase subunit DhaL [Aestuariimicrobium sp. p3-SID1156]|uniref:dihydroxyacetone kinase subunit DhaL n=1 Tax=Aestuariimicrobium sp. p3-SID1156 TaxID=2916038 RepID=UPI00223C0C41|nr:dihydroxyacetone kinase subunit DhaL [Aestuariimicrobium sp. p3-SID1156]MCT1458747.1 dihydroxyacetone kinase subunit DhaL [Aestuariimicrobium sp. p3-SID1156]
MLDTSTAAAWLKDYAETIHENREVLTDLDRQIGDSDHGSNMDRGMAAVAALDPAEFPDAAALLKKAGMTLVSTVGGASGPLYGTFFLRFAGSIGEDGELTAKALGSAFAAGLEGVRARGKAADGEKTMIDALAPAVAALREAAAQDASVADALASAVSAAEQGRDGTVDMLATKGRASYLGERSRGVADPGATSVTLLLQSAARTLS